MKPGTLAPRVIVLLVSVSLAFPPSARVYAEPSRSTLREQQEEHPTQLARLEAALTSGNPDAAVSEIASYLTQPFRAVPSSVAPAAGSPADGFMAGLEERPEWIPAGLFQSDQVRAEIRDRLNGFHQGTIGKQGDSEILSQAREEALAFFYRVSYPVPGRQEGEYGFLSPAERLFIIYAVAHYSVLAMDTRHARGERIFSEHLDLVIGDLERLRDQRRSWVSGDEKDRAPGSFWEDWPEDPAREEIELDLELAYLLREELKTGRRMVAPSVIHDWNRLELAHQRRIRAQFRRIDSVLLRRLVGAAQHPVNPPDTLYEVVAQALGKPQDEVQGLVESLGSEAYLPPETIPIGESETVAWDEAVVREELEGNVIALGAGGAGRWFKGSLTPAYRKQLERLNHFEKPLAMIGPSGTSPVVTTLEQISALAKQVDARRVNVVVVTSEDTDRAIRQDIARNGKRIDRRRVRIHVVQQGMLPSFHAESRKLLTTWSVDPSDPRPSLRMNPNGTYGIFSAAYRIGQRRGFGAGKGMLVLYGDDPILNNVEFIARALSAGRDLDVAPVVTRKRSRLYPPGGTAVDLALPDGTRVPLIVEKAERDPDEKKGIVGLPAFNQAEDEASRRGENRYGFNTGVLKLSAKAAQKAAQWGPKIKYRHAIREGILQLELFLTHIPTLVGILPDMRYGALSVDYEEYGAAKNMAGVAQALATQDERSRRLLEQLPGVNQLRLHPEAILDVRPGFRGFTGDGILEVRTPAGVVLGPEGVTVVPVVRYDPVLFEVPDPDNPAQLLLRRIDHPIFPDPGETPAGMPAAEGMVAVSEDRTAAPAAPERTLYQRVLDLLSEPVLQAIARSGATSLETLTERNRVDFLKLGGVASPVVDEIESALDGFGRSLGAFSMQQTSSRVLTGDPEKDPVLQLWARSLSSIDPDAHRIFLERVASYRAKVTQGMQRSLDEIHYSRDVFEDSVLRTLWEKNGVQPTQRLQAYLARRIFDLDGKDFEAELYGGTQAWVGPLQDWQGVIRISSVLLPHLIKGGFLRLVREPATPWGLTPASFRIALVEGVTWSSLQEHLNSLPAGLEESSPVRLERMQHEDLSEVRKLEEEERERRRTSQPPLEQGREFLADGSVREKGEGEGQPRWRARWVGSRWEEDFASYMDAHRLDQEAFGLRRREEGLSSRGKPVAFVAFRWVEEAIRVDHLLIHPDEPTGERMADLVKGLFSLRHPTTDKLPQLVAVSVPALDQDAFEAFKGSGFQEKGTFESVEIDAVETYRRLVYDRPSPLSGAGLEALEDKARQIVEEVAGIIDGGVRQYPYGLAPLLQGGKLVVSQREAESREVFYDVQFNGVRRTLDANGFSVNGSISNDRAAAIAELVRARAQRTGIADKIQVQVKAAEAPIWGRDFFVEVQAGSYREVLSATPGTPTRGATFGEVVRVYPSPKGWGALGGPRFLIRRGGERPQTVPMAWIPLRDGEHAVLITAGVDPGDGRLSEPSDGATLLGLDRPFRFLYESMVIQVREGKDLAGRSLVIQIPKGLLRSLHGKLGLEARADVLGWFREQGLSVGDIFYRPAPGGWQEARGQELGLQDHLLNTWEAQDQAYRFILYDLFAALKTWPAIWDAAQAGLEQVTPVSDWQEWRRGVIPPPVSGVAQTPPAVAPLETAQVLAQVDTAEPAAVVATQRYAGRPEMTAPEPPRGASDFSAVSGTARPFPEMALQAYLRQEGVVPALERNGGLLRLNAEQAGRLVGTQIQRWGKAVKGAILVRGGDSAAATLRAGQLIFADSDLSNPSLNHVWTKVGSRWVDLEEAMPLARRGDLVLGEERDVAPEVALNSLRARFPAGEAPVVILGTQEGIHGLSRSALRAYQDRALEVEEPEVWVLSVSVRLEERAGETFHLIIRL